MNLTAFFNSAIGHAIVSAVVTGIAAAVAALANDPTLSGQVGYGGLIVTVLKLFVDSLNRSVPTTP